MHTPVRTEGSRRVRACACARVVTAILGGALAAALIVPAAGCAAKKKTATADDVAGGDRAGGASDAEVRSKKIAKPDGDGSGGAGAGSSDIGAHGPIYFSFDSSLLEEDARGVLSRLGDLLLSRPELRVKIYGHTDERGTDEYNLALGAGRAGVARDFLVRLGVAPERIEVITYGEERPAAAGAGEEAWEKNRRDEFEIRPSGS